MKKMNSILSVALVSLSCVSTLFAQANITGAGATFPAPLYMKWAEAYKAKANVGINYQSVGSGAGIKQIKAKTVEFGASDQPLSQKDLDESGLFQFPTCVGAIVPVINLPGIQPGQLKLTGPVLADIYMGKITKWDDAALAKINPGVKLPSLPITSVHRADGSGTTFNFTYYLGEVSAEWKTKIGVEKSVPWPNGIAAKGNEGVAASVKQFPGSIGYVEFAYAKQNKMTYTQMQNKSGVFVQPSEDAFKAAAAGADWDRSPNFGEILANQPGKGSWPMTAATFILIQKSQDDAAKGLQVINFFKWAYAEGDKLALDLDYIPMPQEVVTIVNKKWQTLIKDASGKAIYK